jgi:hypothetical protein
MFNHRNVYLLTAFMLDIQCCHIHTKSCQIDITATTEGRLFYYQFLKEPTVHVQSQACVFANSIHAGPKTSPPWWWSLQPLILHQNWRKEGFWNVRLGDVLDRQPYNWSSLWQPEYICKKHPELISESQNVNMETIDTAWWTWENSQTRFRKLLYEELVRKTGTCRRPDNASLRRAIWKTSWLIFCKIIKHPHCSASYVKGRPPGRC